MLQTKVRNTLIVPVLVSLLDLFLYNSPLWALAQQSNSQVQQASIGTQLPAGLTRPIVQAQATPLVQRRSGRRKPASARGPCSPSEKSLTALIPETNMGLTVSDRPTLFFYIPPTPATIVELVLIDEENGDKVYETTLPITGSGGIISLRLSASPTLRSLEIGKDYHWYFSIVCDPEDRAGDIYVDGWIRRVEPDPILVSYLQKASPGELLALYRNDNLWYDTVTTLAEQHRSNPHNSAVATEWANFLKSVGLEEISQEPFNKSSAP